jgi:hypothetical protein
MHRIYIIEGLILTFQIQDGEIYAKINQRDGMVVFLDNKERYDNPEALKRLEDQVCRKIVCSCLQTFVLVLLFERVIYVFNLQITRCIELNKRLSEMNEKLETNPDFISKVVLTSGGGGAGNISGSIGMNEDQQDGSGISAVASSSSSGKIGSFNM